MRVVQVNRRRGHLVAILLDDDSEILIDKRTWEESPYGVDSFLSCDQIEQLKQQSRRDRAEDKAVFLLSRCDYSRRQLEQKLCREKGRYCAENKDLAKQTAEKMELLGYVNDQNYAKRLARCYQQERLYPRRRAVEALCQKGVDRELARQAVDEIEKDDAQLALEFLRKKRYTVGETREEQQLLAAKLARYGFSGEDIRRAMAWRWEEEHNGN